MKVKTKKTFFDVPATHQIVIEYRHEDLDGLPLSVETHNILRSKVDSVQNTEKAILAVAEFITKRKRGSDLENFADRLAATMAEVNG